MEILNGKQLKAIAHKSHTATVVATSLALRERLRNESDITRTKNALIREGERIVESDYMQFWKDLQQAGAGTIIYGRKGKADRFSWHYSLKKVAEGMLEGRDVMTGQKVAEAKEVKATPKVAVTPKTIIRKASVQMKTQSDKLVYIPLRPNFDLELKVPSDFSKEEVELVTRALSRVAL